MHDPILVTTGTPWQLTLLSTFLGALIGGLVTFISTSSKTRADIKWKWKIDAYRTFIDEVDQVSPKRPEEVKKLEEKLNCS